MKPLLALAALLLALGSPAQPAPAQPAASAPESAPLAEGEVRRIDREQAKLTLRHGPIAGLGMPAMTMVFRVAEPRLLDGLQVGDKVRFAAENRRSQLTLTRIEVSR